MKKSVNEGMKQFHITKTEFEGFKALQLRKHRRGWWAVFSVNRHEDVWPFICYGITPSHKREYVPKHDNKLLFDVARYYLSNIFEEGGRFFIDSAGVLCIKGECEDQQVAPVQFIKWKHDQPLPNLQAREGPRGASLGTPITSAELHAKIRGH